MPIHANIFGVDLPNPALTSGAINLNITQANIQQTICMKGFTKTIRSPVSYTNMLKKQQIHQYGYANTNTKLYKEDHLIELYIGSAPNYEKSL